MTENREGPLQVLFLCAANSARSIMAEAIMNRVGAPKFKAYSAGFRPSGQIHPRAVEVMRSNGYLADGLRSKSWDEFTAPSAPNLDFVFVVCDETAERPLPSWPGAPIVAHWGTPDPLAATGNEAEIGLAFADAFRVLNNRISLFTSLPIASLDRLALQNRLDEIGRSGRRQT